MSRWWYTQRNRGDRGVTMVEYGLVVALVVSGSLATLENMDGEVETHLASTADDIGQSSLSHFAVPTSSTTSTSTTSTSTTSTTSTTTTTNHDDDHHHDNGAPRRPVLVTRYQHRR